MSYIGGLYTGVRYFASTIDNATGVAVLDNKIDSLVTDREIDGVVSVFMIPTDFFTSARDPKTLYQTITRPTSVDGYVPRNKKLLTYPFNFLCVDTVNDSHTYRYEYSGSGNGSIQFALSCAMSPTPEIIIYPRNYNGTSGSNITESVTMSGFPQCAYTVDAYRAYMANYALLDGLHLAQDVAGTAGQVYSLNAFGAASSAIGVASDVVQMTMNATAGSKTRGVQGSSTAVGTRLKKVYFKTMSVTWQYATIIDSYFDRYGYACCKIKVPNRNVRPHWTYTKTRDCCLGRAEMPIDAVAKIKSIYNKGITFWRYGSEVGQYDLNNSPV